MPWPNGPESSTTLYFDEVRQAAVPVEHQTTTVFVEFIRMCMALWAKYAVYEYLTTQPTQNRLYRRLFSVMISWLGILKAKHNPTEPSS